jgi:uncharacterized membrane protein
MALRFRDAHRLKLLLILALAALLRFFGLGVKQLWTDEIIQVIHSRPDSLREILEGVAQDRGGAPLDYLVQHVFIANLSGAIEWTARFHAALFGLLGVLMIYLVCKELLKNQQWALMSALLFCFYPFHHRFSQEGRPYSLFVLLTLILYLVLLRSLKRNSWFTWATFTAMAVVTFYTHAYAALVLFGQYLFLICYQYLERESRSAALRRQACFLAGSAFAAASYLPWLHDSFSNAKGDTPPQIGFRLFREMIKGLGDGSYPLAIALILCAVAGACHLIRERRLFETSALLLWFLSPIPIILAVLAWRSYFFAPRQLLFATPALLILAAVGVDYVKQKIGCMYFSPAIFLILISVAVIVLHYPDKRDDLRAAGLLLKESTQPGDVIVSPDTIGLLSLYFPDIYQHSRDNLSAKEISELPETSRIIYVDPRLNQDRALLNSLRAGMRLLKELSFRGVTVYFFAAAR